MHAATADRLIGRLLEGRYRIRARLAVGGMSTVYAAVDDRLDREVAVKVMASSLSSDPAFIDRFAHEARAAAKLSHVNAVSVYDQGSDHGDVFLVMELVRGRTLRDLLHERGMLSPAEAVSLMEPVLAALASAHRAGLVHRDVKPENILLSDEGVVKVADFGLARAVETNVASTRTGLMMGTVAYSSPEQFRGGSADMRSDVYSAGVVLFELLTGRQPHVGADAMAVAYAHVHTDAPPPSSLQRGIAPAFDALLRRVTARDPADRPADAGVFLGELHDLRRELRLPVLPVPRRPRAGRTPPGAPPGPTARGAAAGGGTPATPNPRDPTARDATRILGPVRGGADRIPDDASTARTAPDPRPGISPVQHTRVTPGGIGGGISPAGAPDPPLGSVPPDRPAGRGSPGRDDRGSRRGRGRSNRGSTAVARDGPRDAAAGGSTTANRRGPRRRRRPLLRAFVGALILLLIAAAITAASWYYAAGRYGTIPDVRDKPVGQATVSLRDHGFAVVVDAAQPSETVAAGAVIRTIPPTGDRLVRGRSVHIMPSAGPTFYPVPDVSGQSRAAAEQTLAPLSANSVTVRFAEQSDESVNNGLVIKTDPPAGTKVRQNSTVLVYLSTGPPIVAVPDVSNARVADATTVLTKAGFLVTTKDAFSDTVGKGLVIKQTPAGNAPERKGSRVTLVVSKGQDLVVVPALPKLDAVDQATQTMQAAGLVVTVQTSFGGNYGLVVSTDPPAGTQLKRGTVVTLYVI